MESPETPSSKRYLVTLRRSRREKYDSLLLIAIGATFAVASLLADSYSKILLIASAASFISFGLGTWKNAHRRITVQEILPEGCE